MEMSSKTESKDLPEPVRNEHVEHAGHRLTYVDEEEEPELHFRTYCAVAAMFLLNFVQVFALTGPPVVVRHSGPCDIFGAQG